MSCPYHHEKPIKEHCAHCESGDHARHQAQRRDWIDRCSQCEGGLINLNEIGGYKWCGQCGAKNFNPQTDADIVTLSSRHSVEEIMSLTGMRKMDIQNAIVRAIARGEVAAYSPTQG